MTDSFKSAIEVVRRDLDQSISIQQRARNFWAGVVCARHLATPEIVARQFKQLAEQTQLTAHLTDQRRRLDGQEIIQHLIRWGLFNRNPFI